jgi:hypothetical protein
VPRCPTTSRSTGVPQTGQGWKIVRYADDFVLLSHNAAEAEQ